MARKMERTRLKRKRKREGRKAEKKKRNGWKDEKSVKKDHVRHFL